MVLIIGSFFVDNRLETIYDESDYMVTWAQPSSSHPLGTDGYGFDVLTFLLIGIKTNIKLFLLAVVLFSTSGLFMGIGLSYMKGLSNKIFDALFNLINSIPLVLLILLILIIIEGFFDSYDTFRKLFLLFNVYAVVSASKLSIELRGRIEETKRKDFIESSKALGLSPVVILFKHIIYYNCRKSIIANTLHFVAQLLFIEITLTYLDLGATGDVITIGSMFKIYFTSIDAFTTLNHWHVAVPSFITLYFIFVLTQSTKRFLKKTY